MGQSGSTSSERTKSKSGASSQKTARRGRSGLSNVMEGGDCSSAPARPRERGSLADKLHPHSNAPKRNFHAANVPDKPVDCVPEQGTHRSYLLQAMEEQHRWRDVEEDRAVLRELLQRATAASTPKSANVVRIDMRTLDRTQPPVVYDAARHPAATVAGGNKTSRSGSASKHGGDPLSAGGASSSANSASVSREPSFLTGSLNHTAPNVHAAVDSRSPERRWLLMLMELMISTHKLVDPDRSQPARSDGEKSSTAGAASTPTKTAAALPSWLSASSFPSSRSTGVVYFIPVAGPAGKPASSSAHSAGGAGRTKEEEEEEEDAIVYVQCPPAELHDLPVGLRFFQQVRRTWSLRYNNALGSYSAFDGDTCAVPASLTDSAPLPLERSHLPSARERSVQQDPLDDAGTLTSMHASRSAALSDQSSVDTYHRTRVGGLTGDVSTPRSVQNGSMSSASPLHALGDEDVLEAATGSSTRVMSPPVPLTRVLQVLRPQWQAEGLYEAAGTPPPAGAGRRQR